MCVILNLKRKSLKKTLLMCSANACSFPVQEHGRTGLCRTTSCSLLGDDLEDDGWNSRTGCQKKLHREGRGKGVGRFFLVFSQPLFDMP